MFSTRHKTYEKTVPGVSFFVAYFASPFQHGRRRLNFIKNAWFRRRGMLLQFELSWFLLPYVCKKLQCWQLIFCFQGNIAVLKKQVFSAHTRTFEKNLTVHYQSQSRKWLIYKNMSVISYSVVSNVKAYKTRRFQSKCKRKTCTESSIPPLQNHVVFIKIRLRFLC